MAKKDNIKFKMPYRKQPFYNSIVKFAFKIFIRKPEIINLAEK